MKLEADRNKLKLTAETPFDVMALRLYAKRNAVVSVLVNGEKAELTVDFNVKAPDAVQKGTFDIKTDLH